MQLLRDVGDYRVILPDEEPLDVIDQNSSVTQPENTGKTTQSNEGEKTAHGANPISAQGEHMPVEPNVHNYEEPNIVGKPRTTHTEE